MPIQHLSEPLRVWANSAAPAEACALVLDGPPELVPLRNCSPSPETGFELDPLELLAALKAAGPRAHALVHSHPSGDPSPSRADLEGAWALGELEGWVIALRAGELTTVRYR